MFPKLLASQPVPGLHRHYDVLALFHLCLLVMRTGFLVYALFQNARAKSVPSISPPAPSLSWAICLICLVLTWGAPSRNFRGATVSGIEFSSAAANAEYRCQIIQATWSISTYLVNTCL